MDLLAVAMSGRGKTFRQIQFAERVLHIEYAETWTLSDGLELALA